MSTLLQLLNNFLHPGTTCPGGGALGECAAIVKLGDSLHITGGTVCEAQVYLWPAGFGLDPARIRRLLMDAGCDFVVVSQVLDDQDNGTMAGETLDGGRHWTVCFHAPAALMS